MSKENLVLKLRVDADPQTIGELDGQSRICNWLYNHLLEKSLELKREFIQSGSPEASKTLYSKRGLRNTLPQLKKDHPFLKAVHSSPLKNTALRLSDAIQVHQKSKKGKRKGKQMGWPKFRAWKQGWFSLFYDEPEKGFRIQGKTLILSLGMGQDGKHRCNKKSKKLSVLDGQGNPTGKEFYIPSKQWKKHDHTLKSALRKRREQTRTFMFTSAHRLFREYDCIGIGDYTPDGEGIAKPMRRAMNNRSLIGRWKKTLSWVARKSGKTLIEFDERGTTRTCSRCLRIEEQGIHVSLRQWQCPQCQTVHIRDENAAINGLRKILRDLPQKNEEEYPSIVSGSDLAFIQKRWAWCVLPNGVHIAPWGQNCEGIHSTRKLNRGRDSPRSKVDNLVIYDQV